MQNNNNLVFDGSLWCNLDIVLRKLDQFYKSRIRPENLSVIEWYILRALYKKDGQYASELAKAVGRAATSFTPNLDKLQSKRFIERRGDKSDRRAVRIFLTPEGESIRKIILDNAHEIDDHIKAMFADNIYENFQHVLHTLFDVNGK